MTIYNVVGTRTLSEFPLAVDSDTVALHNDATLMIDASTVPILRMVNSSLFSSVQVNNTSIATPIIVRFSSVSSDNVSRYEGNKGSLIVNGAGIRIGSGDGIARTFSVPADVAGAFPPHMPVAWVDGVKKFTRCTSLASLYADERGEHFTYDAVTGVMTFGDGINGKMPVGDIVIPNIYVDFRGTQCDVTLATISPQWCVFGNIDLRAGCIVTNGNHWAIEDNTQEFSMSNVHAHTLGEFAYIGLGDNNARIKLAEITSMNAVFSTESNVQAEVVQSEKRPLNGSLMCKYLTERDTLFPRTRLTNDGGTLDLAVLGGRGGGYRVYGGSNGTISRLRYSTSYLMTDSIPFRLIHNQNDCTNQRINAVIRVGDEIWPEEMENLVYSLSGELHVANIETPAESSFDELLHLGGDSKGSIENVTHLGVSNSGSRDLNIYSLGGWQINNLKTSDTMFGNQSAANVAYHFVSINGELFQVGDQLKSATIYTTTDYDAGEIVLQPHVNFADSTSHILVGSADDIIVDGNKFHVKTTTTKISNESNLLQAVGRPTSLVILGDNTQNFTIDYRMRLQDGAFPDYKTLRIEDIQTDWDTGEFTTDSQWFFEYTIQRINGTAADSSISGIYIECPIDPGFFWAEPLGSMKVIFQGVTIDDYICVKNNLGVVVNYFQATAASETITIPGIAHGQVWDYAVGRVGYRVALGNIKVVVNDTLPISIGLIQHKKANGDAMYSGSSSDLVSIHFDLSTPQASIIIGDIIVTPQVIFDEVERALVTSKGLTWQSQQKSIVEHDDITGLGRILNAGNYWRLMRDSESSINAGVDGRVESAQRIPVDGSNGDVTYISSTSSDFAESDRETLHSIVDILEADEEIRKDSYKKLHKKTRVTLLQKSVAKIDDNIDLMEFI